jgi:hypothetical protein
MMIVKSPLQLGEMLSMFAPAMIDTLPPSQVVKGPIARVQPQESNPTGTSARILAACLVLALVSIYLGLRLHGQNAELAAARSQLAESNSKAVAIQASLDTAKAQASSLQEQLVGDQGQRLNLQSQLDQARTQSAALQAQQARDQSRLSDLQAQVDQEKARSAGIQARFDRASQETSSVQAQLEQTKTQAAAAQAQLVKAQGDLTRLHPLLVEARQLPLTAVFEKSFWDQGFALHLSNSGTAPLKLTIRITGQNKPRAEMAEIEGGETLNLGRLPAGEHVVIASDGFDPLNLTAR